jgi:phosphopantothenoylcysteine synthetase/decarboxylase
MEERRDRQREIDQCICTLERTRDILGSLRSEGSYRGVLIGFAAETENVLAHALDKLHRKGCDLIVANDVSQPGSVFDADDNEVDNEQQHQQQPPQQAARSRR